MKAVVATFNQEKALVGAFSVITNLRMDLFEALTSDNVTLYVTVGTMASVLCRLNAISALLAAKLYN